ncbi:hypothetical protein QTI66_08785 [Variovorax sp. J22R133]|uniref:hypothetical protein n=1 Tax=Variovorax brevis TaxID=3053503 RepID=UPI002578FC32|nr:hypothetical protein [Variovorax sp. J22R133]MDM0112244.1 hypothetical protein [Variovorax sp. J22R133]
MTSISPAQAIEAYIRAKDGNRPYLLNASFAADASLRMDVRTDSVAFPPESSGREGIAETVVRRFNQTYENIYTLCIGSPPRGNANSHSNIWLVAMSEKSSGAVRVGCGRYDWSFEENGGRVKSLTITIETMAMLPPATLASVMNWVSALPYPWCSQQVLFKHAPRDAAVQLVLGLIGNSTHAQ